MMIMTEIRLLLIKNIKLMIKIILIINHHYLKDYFVEPKIK